MRQGGATDGRNRNPKVSRLVPSRLNLSGDEMRAGRLLKRSRCLGSIALVSVSGPVSLGQFLHSSKNRITSLNLGSRSKASPAPPTRSHDKSTASDWARQVVCSLHARLAVFSGLDHPNLQSGAAPIALVTC